MKLNNLLTIKSLIIGGILISSLLCYAAPQAEEPIRIFEQNSYQKIIGENIHKPFILILWSIDCPPCYEELKFLGQYLKQYKKLSMVFVSTDPLSEISNVQAFIREVKLDNQEHWIYASESRRKLDYSIDPYWYGELPRSYFFIPGHNRKSYSGKLTDQELEKFSKALLISMAVPSQTR